MHLSVTISDLRAMVVAVLLAVALPLMAAHTVESIPNVHVADRTQYVSNPDGVLSQQAVASLNATLADAWQRSSAEPVVVVVDDIDSDDVDGFATELFEKWGIGKSDKDNGVLMLVVRDKRKAVIRTGYGSEGVLPDVIAGRILREEMFPRFRQGDYDGGVVAGTQRMASLLTDPDAVAELMSEQANDARAGHADIDFDGEELWNFYLRLAAILGAGGLVIVALLIFSSRKEEEVTRYRKLNSLRMPLLFVTFFSLGMALPAFLWLYFKMKRLRDHKRKCPNCDAYMTKLDEETDNKYLTPAQDTEERINSIDYDVWLCPQCNTTEIIPYVNRSSSYSVCPRCGAKACTLMGSRTVVPPTQTREGQGEHIYNCLNCHHQDVRYYTIAKLPPVIIIPSGGGRGFGGGGGFSGGSFGGGSTGGGGASGGW